MVDLSIVFCMLTRGCIGKSQSTFLTTCFDGVLNKSCSEKQNMCMTSLIGPLGKGYPGTPSQKKDVLNFRILITNITGTWLVVWNIFFHIWGIIIPTDQYFSEGLKPPTRYIRMIVYRRSSAKHSFFWNHLTPRGAWNPIRHY